MTQNKYGVQWVDDGGVFEHYTTIEDLQTVFKKMELVINVIDDGGVTLTNGRTHYYITTDIPIPFWIPRGQVRNSPDRYCDSADLWLYTFEIHENQVKMYHTHDEYIKMMDW